MIDSIIGLACGVTHVGLDFRLSEIIAMSVSDKHLYEMYSKFSTIFYHSVFEGCLEVVKLLLGDTRVDVRAVDEEAMSRL